MPRKHRIHFPGACYHALNRGNRREPLFLESRDYQYFLESIVLVQKRYAFRVYAFCLMPNHFHLIIEVGHVPLSTIMRSLLTRYAQYFNRKYHKVGHVFQGRYRAILCQKEAYLLELMRYIHMNPVRAGLVSRPEKWRWSSYRDYVHGRRHAFLTTGLIKAQFRDTRSFIRFHLEHDGSKDARRFERGMYPSERYPVLGEPDFMRAIKHEHEPRRRVIHKGIVRRSLDEICRRICKASGIFVAQITAMHRPREISDIRSKIVYAAMHFCEIKPSKIASFLKISPSGVTRCYRRFHLLSRKYPAMEQEVLALLES
ncbi:MAG: hypothetical protein A3G34_14885 [Candidatus Lindowbacteria bacterium RIFCSPLOWO2_12_FULL_62_27]|nr:MAG: hypothetical protein A3I06_10165 [Candidatus Lindowbacteria bacterium RIFCSPLOWO2_02_FULL_62_12]OGH63140.1 MAG: hypothetical protein A3G34_14885 [Candidatus Lindowbacteria bacterium RIFCSPLOWO2_12_FULL_62_27]